MGSGTLHTYSVEMSSWEPPNLLSISGMAPPIYVKELYSPKPQAAKIPAQPPVSRIKLTVVFQDFSMAEALFCTYCPRSVSFWHSGTLLFKAFSSKDDSPQQVLSAGLLALSLLSSTFVLTVSSARILLLTH